MKKVSLIKIAILILSISILSSCSKNYSFNYNIEDKSGVTVEVTLFEYNKDGEKIANHHFVAHKGLLKTFKAKSETEKVKVLINFSTEENPQSASDYLQNNIERWCAQVYYLKRGKTVNIIIDETTFSLGQEP